MAWVNLIIISDQETSDQISDRLLELGALSASIQDKNLNQNDEELIFGEPHNGPHQYWQNSKIESLFSEHDDVKKIIEIIEAEFDTKVEYEIQKVEDENWVEKTQAQFQPIKVTDDLWILPSWHGYQQKDAINLILDPGLAFGTGSHPTTFLCLQWIKQNLDKGQTLLDYGCGSGILAIAAKKLGAASVLGVDIDKQAIHSSIDNAKKNGVDIEFINTSESIQIKADLVVANILSSSLAVLAPALASYCKQYGRIALSGILEGQEDYIKSIYAQWFKFEPSLYQDGWVCLSGIKN
jgi:ribosomal protein L11 methyltransferase